MSSNTAPEFEFLLFDGFSNMVLASAMEPLRDVKMRSSGTAVNWTVSTLEGAPVYSSSGLRIAPDRVFEVERAGRNLVLVAGFGFREIVTPELCAKLRRAVRMADRVIGVDAAPWLLAAAGVLDGHSATIHWQELTDFEEAFPNVKVSNARQVRSGSFITCGGASAVLDMSLALIQDLFGPVAAFEASTMFVYDPERQADNNRGAARLLHKSSPKILAALNAMAKNIETPLTTFELADSVSLSERALCRKFTLELGMTPGKYYRMFRLQRARYLAEETELSAEQIALRCGFSTASSLGRSLQSTFGSTLRGLRHAPV